MISIIFLIVLISSSVTALPRPFISNYLFSGSPLLHRRDENNRPSFWQPPTSISYFTEQDQPDHPISTDEDAVTWLMHRLGYSDTSFMSVNRMFTDAQTNITHLYGNQMYNGLAVINANMNMHMDGNGNIIACGNSFADLTANPKNKLLKRDSIIPIINATEAVIILAESEGLSIKGANFTEEQDGNNIVYVSGAPFTSNTITAQLSYYQTPSSLGLVWTINMQLSTRWPVASISAVDGEILGTHNWASHIKYQFIDVPSNSILDGPPRIEDESNIIIPTSSPKGWTFSSTNSADFASTVGNNVVAGTSTFNQGRGNNIRTVQVTDGNFDFPISNKGISSSTVQAAITNMFVISNLVHDIAFAHGFDEASGNFQMINFGGQGFGNDAVLGIADDPSGVNNAFFMSPPDGVPGQMSFFQFTLTSPPRDSALENQILIHELTHGISSRLSGGADNANCLTSPLAGGMGEGWSDMMALILTSSVDDKRDTNRPLAPFVSGNPVKGLRTFPYSTNLNVNPLTYSVLNDPAFHEVHKIGEVWASLLFEVYWNLIDKRGFDSDAANIAGGKGNVVMINTLINSFKQQGCQPSFITARNAMLNVNKQDTCAIWKGFAKRGLGSSAQDITGGPIFDDFSVPSECK